MARINPWDSWDRIVETIPPLTFAMHQYLAVDVCQGCHLLHIVFVGSNLTIADVEVDALVEQNCILKGS